MQRAALRRRQGEHVVHDEDRDEYVVEREEESTGWATSKDASNEGEKGAIIEDEEDIKRGERLPLLSKKDKDHLSAKISDSALNVSKKDWILEVLQLLLEQVSTFFQETTPSFLSISYFTSLFSSGQIDENTAEMLKEFKRHAQQPYDKGNEDHEAQLLMLWNCSFPEEQLDERITKQWGKLGFQGTDPATDFRGWGLFGLKNILYFAEKYPVKFRRLVEGQHHAEAYPFAITSLNITDMLFDILGLGFRPSTTPSSAKKPLAALIFPPATNRSSSGDSGYQRDAREKEDSEEEETIPEGSKIAFQEVYCAAFEVFDQEWVKANAKYMDFPRVQVEAKKQLEKLIVSKFTSLEKVIEWNAASSLNKKY